MKKISKLILVLAALAMVFSAVAVTASADTVAEATFGDMYFGEYDATDSDLSGMANIVFGQIDRSFSTRYYGIIVTADADGSKKVFPGQSLGDEGKFGVALYDMPDGYYTAQVYMGKPEDAAVGDGTLSSGVRFYANNGLEAHVFVMTNYSREYRVAVQSYVGGTAEAPEDLKAAMGGNAPANSIFDGYYTDQTFTEEFDWSQTLTGSVEVYAKWVSDGSLTNKVIAYKSVSNQSHASSIGTSAGVDLSGENNQLVLTYDVLSSATYANHQTKIYVQSYLPTAGANGYNNGWSGTMHMGLAGNPAYTTEDKNHYGYLSCTPGFTMPGVQFGTNSAEASDCMLVGTTFKAVYTAPTDTEAGSLVWYSKPSMSGDEAYVETASMRNITGDLGFTGGYMGLDFYNCSAGPGASMTFTNFKVMHGDREIPLELFNHTDSEFTITDKYVTDTSKVYEFGINACNGDAQAGWLMMKDPTSTTNGGTIYLEMDVLETNLADRNVNFGIAWFNYLGVSNNWASGFHDTHWTGNPMYTDAEDGASSWKLEDVSGSAPTLDYFYVEEIWAAGNSVRVEYSMPTATVDGYVAIYVKAIEDGEDAWELWALTEDITQDCIVNYNNVIHMGIHMVASQGDGTYLKVTNLRAYTALGDVELVAQHNLFFREVEA